MDEIAYRFGDTVTCTLIEGDRGVFDVVVDGQVIFSKYDRGRFPGSREISRAIEGLRG
ncbi:MAG: Rdx family protein [Myxococcales bacterium]|nr:Rdx family protein [Myxococcales bacterium]